MTTYYLHITARCDCRWCETRPLVVCHHEIDCGDDLLYDVDGQIEEAVEAQKTSDGWHSGYCPHCIYKHGAEIRAQEKADSDDL
jgi:hypothetical protein